MTFVSGLKSRVLSLSPEEGSFARRGFPGRNSDSREHLERVIGTFIEGYNQAVRESNMDRLSRRLDAAFPPAFLGFAYEGAGLFFALADLVAPGAASRLHEFTRRVAPQHDFITVVGAGFAIARLPFGIRRLSSYQAKLDPMTAWCLTDGLGFHQGFFHWRRFIEGRESAPSMLDAQGRALFDAGIGRAMWWVFGAEPEAIASAISRFVPDRQAEMWVGIGTALAYADGTSPGSLSRLAELADIYRTDLLSGIPLAAHMRVKGGNPAAWTDFACSELLHLSASEASRLVVSELDAFLNSWLGSEREKWDQCYLALRNRIRARLADADSQFTLSLEKRGLFTKQ